ncbi:MAG: UdgX family uracil-DNA binding protein [Myxococcales bacterium]|nr:UdgX family uracil-DNA binding protein [Myxococcales bacterium]
MSRRKKPEQGELFELPPKKDGALAYLPEDAHDLGSLAKAIHACEGCSIHENATQPVFGDGAADSRMVLVGEQPGDKEDLAGKPFVGPAGRLLDKTLEAAGIDRGTVYITNVVKHFKWTPRGKRRLHSKPSPYEIRACQPWLEAELSAIKPKVLVLMGSTAAQAVLGSGFRVTKSRGEPHISPFSEHTFATLHPAALLRIQLDYAREAAEKEFIEDFKKIAAYL